MSSRRLRRLSFGFAVGAAAFAGSCSADETDGRAGPPSSSAAGSSAAGAMGPGAAASAGAGGAMDKPSVPAAAASDSPWPADTALSAARKVKNLLIGLAPTDADVAELTAHGALGLQRLIDGWITSPDLEPLFRAKMLVFFRNAFQQTGFTPTEDFKPQLLENGGFDFGPFGRNAVGDDAFTRLVQNLEESFARTALQLVGDRRP